MRREGESDKAEESDVNLVETSCDPLVFLDTAKESLDDISFSVGLRIIEILWCQIGISWDVNISWRDDWLGDVISDQLSDMSRIVG